MSSAAAGFAPSTAGSAAPGAPAGSVFVKRAGDARARFAKVAIFEGDAVTDLAERATLKLGWGVSAAYVDLFLVKLGGDRDFATPTQAQIDAVLADEGKLLGEGVPLSRAGVASGAWVVARLQDAPAAAPRPGQAPPAGGAGQPDGPAGDDTESFGDLVAKLSAVTLASPGAEPRRGKSALFADGLASFEPGARPLAAEARVGSGGLAWTSMADATKADYAQSLFSESTFYGALTQFLPEWVDIVNERGVGAKMNAQALFGMQPTPRRVVLPWGCEPEIFVRARAGHPGFNAEIKTAGDRRVFEEVAMYVALDLTNSLFRRSDAVFYAKPPVGYGLVACAHVGYLVSIEWVGVLHVAPVSDPFFLGSDANKAAIAALADVDFGEPVDIGDVAGWTHAGSARAVAWTARPSDGKFFKLICAEAFAPALRAARFRHLHEAYAAYARAFADAADPPPRALLPARLLFGQFSVVAELPFVAGRAATAEELTDAGGRVLGELACAVAWLARRALLHADIRAPNVLVGEGEGRVEGGGGGSEGAPRVTLVDYDDIIVLERAPASFEELDFAYREREVACWCALGALRELVRRSFDQR